MQYPGTAYREPGLSLLVRDDVGMGGADGIAHPTY
jgi:hypothetical protein